MHDIEIVGIINLNCQSPQEIYNSLVGMRRDVYTPNQRIVVQYTELDYFYHDSPVGFVIHNFLTILYHVDISISQITFVTTNNHLKDSIEPFISHDKDVPEIHVVLVSRMTYKNISGILVAPDAPEKNIKYTGLCMMGTKREHRIRLYQYLKHNDLLDSIQVSMHNPKNPMLSVKTSTQLPEKESALIDLGIACSFPMANEFWSKPIANCHIAEFVHVPVPDTLINPNIPASGHDFYKEFAVDIVTESTFGYPSQFVSEKTLRPLLLKTPFVVFGPAYFLKYLQDRGFKTFSDVWDESYDLIENPQDRFIICCHVVKEIASRPLSAWKEIYQKLNDRLDYNREILLKYINTEFVSIHSTYKL